MKLVSKNLEDIMGDVENSGRTDETNELLLFYEEFLEIRIDHINKARKLALRVVHSSDGREEVEAKEKLDDLFDAISHQIDMFQKGNFYIEKKIKRMTTFKVVK